MNIPKSDNVDWFLESQKIAYDTSKHITTLSSGTVVVLATFIKDVFKTPEWVILIPFIFGFLIVAIVGNVLSMIMIFNVIKSKSPLIDHPSIVGQIIAWSGFTGFVGGYVLLSVFAIKNFM